MSQNHCINRITREDGQEVLCGRPISTSTEIEIKHGFHQWSWAMPWCTQCCWGHVDYLDRLVAPPTSAYVPVGDVEILAEYYDLTHRSDPSS